jgi:hypothetical protein
MALAPGVLSLQGNNQLLVLQVQPEKLAPLALLVQPEKLVLPVLLAQ